MSSPFTVGDDGWGWEETVMLGAVVLLLGAVVLPPFLSPRLRRADGSREASTSAGAPR